MEKTRILIVEDDPMARTLLEMYINNSDRYRVAASIESAAIAELFCTRTQVDLILMDVCTGLDASGLKAAEKIKKNYPDIRIIIMTSQPECDFISRAKEAGADSFWYKKPTEQQVMDILDRTMKGESVYPETTPELQIGTIKSSEFTPGELIVLRELTSGDTDEEIAERLHLSAWTVRKHTKSMLEKTNFKSRTQLAVAARQSGLTIRGF